MESEKHSGKTYRLARPSLEPRMESTRHRPNVSAVIPPPHREPSPDLNAIIVPQTITQSNVSASVLPPAETSEKSNCRALIAAKRETPYSSWKNMSPTAQLQYSPKPPVQSHIRRLSMNRVNKSPVPTRLICPMAWRDGLLGIKRGPELTSQDLDSSLYEQGGQSPRLANYGQNPIQLATHDPQTYSNIKHNMKKPGKKPLGGSDQSHSESNTQSSGQESINALIPSPKRPKVQRCPLRHLLLPTLQEAEVPPPVVPPNSSSTPQANFQPGPEPGAQPTMKDGTQPIVKSGAPFGEKVANPAENFLRPSTSSARYGLAPKWGHGGHPPHQGGPAISPWPANIANAGPGNMIYLQRSWQYVGHMSPKQVPVVSTCFPQQKHTPVKILPAPVKILPHDNVERLPTANRKVYDLAQIHDLGHIVINGRVYNKENHPICAAPRENGVPCKRNVSRSPCRWHGEVLLLTPQNTVNGQLDDFGTLVQVGDTPNGAVTGTINEHGQVVPLAQAFTPLPETRALRWTNEDHYWFLLGLQRYGNKWSVISKVVRTRDTLQVQSHAQKWFERQAKVDKKKSTIHDLKLNGREMTAIAAKYTDAERERRINLEEYHDSGELADDVEDTAEAGPSQSSN